MVSFGCGCRVANSTTGRDFEDTFTVGQDSDGALVLLEAAQLDAAGVSAQLVIASVVPGERITDDLAQIDQIRAEFAELDDVVAVADPQISADGTVALVRVQYPPSDEMNAVALEDLKNGVPNSTKSTGFGSKPTNSSSCSRKPRPAPAR